MKKTGKIMLIAAVMFIGTAAFAGPHHHHKRDGLDLAEGIVDLVLKVIRPTPTVTVYQQPHYHRPAPPPRHHRPAKRPAPRPAHRPGHRR